MQNIKITRLPKSEVEIEGELAADLFESYFRKALAKLGENLKLDGFRKGKIPENVLLANIPEAHILGEMAEMALFEHYPKILESEKVDAISRPEIVITKLARKNPLGFKIKTAVLPEIKLPNYKDIGKNIISNITEAEKNIVATDEEVEATIMDIRKSRAPKKHVTEAPSPLQEKAGDEVKEKTPHPDPLLKGEGDASLPEFNDDFVQALGPFKNVANFKIKLKENIKLEKENKQKEKTRLKIIEEIIEKSKLTVPEILIEVELDKILYRMESDITQMGLKFEDYLKHLSKTKENLRTEFRGEAEKKAKLALILNEIAKVEKIVADPELVTKEVTAILEHYKDADPERARMHAENVLTNEKIFQFLENQ
ncbi:hypothetical protein A2738_03525 [Candidatus Nomurabacteria bacterium RIFCSPHIGHO2_01_FULL_42_15]|uniref:Uncharacterized protein n=1 Tax=Candidatus Nomurabacteria bacterium RIFCSPHIGHO2_01_FULL_42_15 TaxID=1801742 RepID=A0A1F6VGG5_9BACT|nr:MAG: hypothetical protein A2738_03525 [Candidatus Nomurabacteria bacterium RIFCSPHIGHO2_01_FULL_42_15]OGI92748.1 MAG: hypothetical protein A3A99_02590 [Candidatus Nomurabacteria bacterium RIFCSPLOWO2_01_FULL_41_18]